MCRGWVLLPVGFGYPLPGIPCKYFKIKLFTCFKIDRIRNKHCIQAYKHTKILECKNTKRAATLSSIIETLIIYYNIFKICFILLYVRFLDITSIIILSLCKRLEKVKKILIVIKIFLKLFSIFCLTNYYMYSIIDLKKKEVLRQ